MGTIFIRALILYFVVIFSVRLMGKRQLGELQPSELVITILISNIATLPLEDTAIPLLPGKSFSAQLQNHTAACNLRQPENYHPKWTNRTGHHARTAAFH